MASTRRISPAVQESKAPIDELIEFEAEASETVPTIEDIIEEVEEAPAETAAQKRIRELQAQIAAAEERDATNPTDENGRPLRVEQLTEEQRTIRELEDKLAKKSAAALSVGYEQASSGETVHINFVKDGFTAAGQVWYRGQEIVYDLNGEAYALTKDKFGNSWVDLANDTAGQYARYGDEYFRPGPFIPRRGEVFNDAIAQEDARRGKAAPVIRL